MNDEKFQCCRCGQWFSQEQMTMIACEGLFCQRCREAVEAQEERDAI